MRSARSRAYRRTFQDIPAGARCSCPTPRLIRTFSPPSAVRPGSPADSERQQEPSITQALHVINGDTINRKLAAKEGLIQTLIVGRGDNRVAIERIYLAA